MNKEIEKAAEETPLRNPLMEKLREECPEADKDAIDKAFEELDRKFLEESNQWDWYGWLCARIPELNKPANKLWLHQFVDKLQQEAAPKWVSVEERLPKEANNYLVYIPGFIDPVTTREFSPEFGRFLDVMVTHWQPLPTPPTP